MLRSRATPMYSWRKGLTSFLAVAVLLSVTTPALAAPSEVAPLQVNRASSYQQAPLPGEILVRFKPALANNLHNWLLAHANPDPFSFETPLPTLIGSRIKQPDLSALTSELSRLFNYYQVWAADAIDPDLGVYRLKTAIDVPIFDMIDDIMSSGQFVYAEPNFPAQMLRDANDPFYRQGSQYALRLIDAPAAWDITTGSSNVTIAIIDTGVAALHEDLSGKVLPGLNFVSDLPSISATDDQGHGTFVAGVAAAKGDNGQFIAGVSWGARILPVKVLDNRGNGSNASIAMGLNYATERGVQVANMSLGTFESSRAVLDAVRKAYARGITLVAAAGNDGTDVPQYPSAYDEVIAVGASTPSDTVWQGSNFGPEISVVAPGTGIVSLTWAQPSGNVYGQDTGTSMSAPFVTGVVALMLSVNPGLSPADVRAIIEGTADAPGSAVSTTPPASVSPTSVTSTAGVSSATPPVGTPTPTAASIARPTTTSATTTSPTTTVEPNLPTVAPIVSPSPGNGATPPTPTTGNRVLPPPPTRSPTVPGPFYNLRYGFGRLNAFKAVQAAQRDAVPANKRGVLRGKILGNFNPQDVAIKLTPGDTRVPLADGTFTFEAIPPGTYRLSAAANKFGLPDGTAAQLSAFSYTFQVNGTGDDRFSWDFDFTVVNSFVNSGRTLGAFRPVPAPTTSDPKTIYFPDTGHTLAGKFRTYWEQNGGLTVFGYPISEETLDNGLTTQYFERAVLEIHPEYNKRNDPYAVQARRLGSSMITGRTATPFQRVPEPSADQIAQADGNLFYSSDFGHTVSGKFYTYWRANGDVDTLGFPISQPFEENGLLVQYFERQKLELHPEFEGTEYEVLGALIGRELAIKQGLLAR